MLSKNVVHVIAYGIPLTDKKGEFVMQMIQMIGAIKMESVRSSAGSRPNAHLMPIMGTMSLPAAALMIK